MRTTVLDWKDIRQLVGICSFTVDRGLSAYESVELARLNLVVSANRYLEQWNPNRKLDDIYRIGLVTDLDEYMRVLRKVGLDPLIEEPEVIAAVESKVAEGRRIVRLLREAMRKPVQDE